MTSLTCWKKSHLPFSARTPWALAVIKFKETVYSVNFRRRFSCVKYLNEVRFFLMNARFDPIWNIFVLSARGPCSVLPMHDALWRSWRKNRKHVTWGTHHVFVQPWPHGTFQLMMDFNVTDFGRWKITRFPWTWSWRSVSWRNLIQDDRLRKWFSSLDIRVILGDRLSVVSITGLVEYADKPGESVQGHGSCHLDWRARTSQNQGY